jgi:Domain of unknown function (DUF4386)
VDLGTNKPTARLAGALYLALAIGSGFAFVALGRVVVPGDAAATLRNITGNETLFRLAMVADVLGQVAFALLAPVLYALFRTVDRVQAALLAILVLVPVPIALASVPQLFALLPLAHLAGTATAAAQAATLLETRAGGVLVAEVFWGLWLIPFGWLTWKSGFLPKVLGPLLALGSVGYLLASFGKLLVAGGGAVAALVPACMVVSTVAELAMVGWLLVFGIKLGVENGAPRDATPQREQAALPLAPPATMTAHIAKASGSTG